MTIGRVSGNENARPATVPATVPAVTINKVCGSGLKAVMLAAQAIKAGDAQVVVAGGMESMSNAPYLLRGMRTGVKFGDRQVVDALINDGLWCSFGECHMGGHAEYTAMKAGIGRADQDEYAYESHRRAVRAIDEGEFSAEIVPVSIPTRKGVTVVDTDEPPRRDTSVEALGKLKPAFGSDAPPEVDEFSVTAGNAPGLNDGAAATLVTSQAYAEANGLDIMARITAYSVGATAPQDLFFAPVVAVRSLMEKEGASVDDYGLVLLPRGRRTD